jgi:hypothetical protein
MTLIFLGLIIIAIIYGAKDQYKLNDYFLIVIKKKKLMIKQKALYKGIEESKKNTGRLTKKKNTNPKNKKTGPAKKIFDFSSKHKNLNSSSSNSNKTINKLANLNKISTLNKDSFSKASTINKMTKSNKAKSLSQLNLNIINNNGRGIRIYKKKKTYDFRNKLKLNLYEDQELNELDYKSALIHDKRTFGQYYWSLLKKKHIILFIVLRVKDYNLLSLKISLFLLSFSLYFAINGFFFNDNTMHKIYIEKGTFNFIYRLPKAIYSTLISGVINVILKQFAITENDILSIKTEKLQKNLEKKSKLREKYLKKRIGIYFFISFLLISFLWYYISCFCSIYQNTQLILIKDTLITFALSMLYPFAINLFPGCFRIPALKAENKDKELLYKIGKLLAQI